MAHKYTKLALIGFCLSSFTCVLAAAPRAQARIAEDQASIDSDAVALHCSRHNRATLTNSKLKVVDVVRDHLSMREYVDGNGRVYAIAWDGQQHPDFSVIMGAYYKEYEEARNVQQPLVGRRHSSLKTQNLVVQLVGHFRHLEGRVYAPSLLPKGVTPEEVQ